MLEINTFCHDFYAQNKQCVTKHGRKHMGKDRLTP